MKSKFQSLSLLAFLLASGAKCMQTMQTVTSIYIPDATGIPLAENFFASVVEANSQSQILEIGCVDLPRICNLPYTPFTITAAANAMNYTASAFGISPTTMTVEYFDSTFFMLDARTGQGQGHAVGGVLLSEVTITEGVEKIVPLVTSAWPAAPVVSSSTIMTSMATSQAQRLVNTNESTATAKATTTMTANPASATPTAASPASSTTSHAFAAKMIGTPGLGGMVAAIAVAVAAL